jgi:hypothetical protein
MPVQQIKANAHVEADKGRVAFMRGPIVYCFEAADTGGAIHNVFIPSVTGFTPEYRSNVLGGVAVLNTTTMLIFRTPANEVVSRPMPVTAVPYYANANRGTCAMQVWMPTEQDSCSPAKQE